MMVIVAFPTVHTHGPDPGPVAIHDSLCCPWLLAFWAGKGPGVMAHGSTFGGPLGDPLGWAGAPARPYRYRTRVQSKRT